MLKQMHWFTEHLLFAQVELTSSQETIAEKAKGHQKKWERNIFAIMFNKKKRSIGRNQQKLNDFVDSLDILLFNQL